MVCAGICKRSIAHFGATSSAHFKMTRMCVQTKVAVRTHFWLDSNNSATYIVAPMLISIKSLFFRQCLQVRCWLGATLRAVPVTRAEEDEFCRCGFNSKKICLTDCKKERERRKWRKDRKINLLFSSKRKSYAQFNCSERNEWNTKEREKKEIDWRFFKRYYLLLIYTQPTCSGNQILCR